MKENFYLMTLGKVAKMAPNDVTIFAEVIRCVNDNPNIPLYTITQLLNDFKKD